MNVTPDQLFARIGSQAVEIDLLRAEIARQEAVIAEMGGKLAASLEPKGHSEANGRSWVEKSVVQD